MVKIRIGKETVTAHCSRCKKGPEGFLIPMKHYQKVKGAVRCPECGWIMIPTDIVDEEVTADAREE